MPRLPRVFRLVAWLPLAITAPTAFAFQLPIEATVSVRFGSMPPLVTQTRVGVAEVGLSGDVLQSVQLSSEIATTGALVGPLPPTTFAPIGGLQATFGAWPTASPLPLRTFVRGTNGRIGGAVRMLGVSRVCLFTPSCPGTNDAFIPFAHATPGTGSLFYDAAVGWQGVWTQQNPAAGVNFTVQGAPWTTATVTAGNGVTGMGFALGPASLPGSTAMDGGRLHLVTPIFIRTSLTAVPLFPAVATLEIRFTGDPPGPACSNGIDDDSDGLIDFGSDPACETAESPREDSKCQDGQDNDADTSIDFDGGAWSNGGVPLTAPDPQCVGRPWRNREKPDGCGLGAELALLLPILAAWRWRQKMSPDLSATS